MFLLYNDFSAKDDWVFFFGRLVAVNFTVNIVMRYSLIGSFDVVSLSSCKCVARWICVIIDCWGKLFGCFEGNFENTGRMEMFSMPGGIVSMFVWFRYLEWTIYVGKLMWCDLLTLKICQIEGTVFVSVHIFVYKINTYRLKRW